MAEETTLSRLHQVVEPLLESMGMELVELEFKREGKDWILRLFIDREGGVTLDDCVEVSRELGALLDVEEVIERSYRLEVSSPGLDRPLKKAGDYVRFCGDRVRIKTYEKLDPDQRGYERKVFVGTLVACEAGRVTLRQMDKRGGDVSFALEEIARANLDPEF